MQRLQTELGRNKIDIDRVLFYCFCGLCFALPVGTSPTVIIGLVLLAIWIFSGKFYRDRDKWRNWKWALPVLAVILLPWAGLLYTEDMGLGFKFAKKSYYWLYAFAIASLALSRHDIKILLNCFLAGLSVFSISSLLQFAGVTSELIKLPTILSTRSISASLLLVFGMLILSFFFPKAEGTGRKIAILSVIVLFFLTLAIGPGRIGHLAYILLAPLLAYNLLGQKHIFRAAAVTVLIVGALFLSPAVKDRASLAVKNVQSYEEGDASSSIGERFYMWNGAISIYRENPVFGAGTGGYITGMRKFKNETSLPVPNIEGDVSDPHNSYLYMAVNYGIVGLLALLWLFGVLLKNGWKNRQDIIGFSILAFTLVLAIGSLTGTQIVSNATGVMLALFAGMQAHLDAG